MTLTSHGRRLQTFGSNLINYVGALTQTQGLLLRHSGDSLKLPQLIRLMVIGWWLLTRRYDV